MKTKTKLSLAQLKSRIGRRLGKLDKDKLRKILLACGLGAALVAAIILAMKFAPLMLVLLALLGLVGLQRLWVRMNYLPMRLCV